MDVTEATSGIRLSTRDNLWVRRLSLVAWSLLTLAYLSVFIIDLFLSYRLMSVPCAGPDCHYQAISSAEAAVLSSWGLSVPLYALYMLGISVLPVVLFSMLAVVILTRLYPQPRAFLYSMMLLVIPVVAIANFDIVAAALPGLTVPVHSLVIVGQWLLITFFLVFPRERFEPRWTVVLPFFAALIGVVTMFDYVELLPLFQLPTYTLLLLTVAGVILNRYRRLFDTTERRQVKWVILGVLVFFAGVPIWTFIFEMATPSPGAEKLLLFMGGWTLLMVITLALPAAIFMAIARENLLDINLIVRKTVVYGLLTALLAAVYLLSVAFLQTTLALFTGRTEPLAIILSTLLIAALFQPVRERLQRATARLFFGERDDPYAVLSKLARQLEESAVPGESLPGITTTITQTLKLPYAAIQVPTIDGLRRTVAETGHAPAPPEEWPLRYQGQVAGWLAVAQRTPGEAFTARERQLLADIASQAGAAAHAAQLTAALQRSREKLVLAREEERRRIRRDLHDELGPALASQTFKLDAALDLIDSDPATAAAILASLKIRNQELVGDIRRLVYELRPPALDELGLVGALQAHFGQLDSPAITIVANPDPLPPLPAAVEVAAYRIALEAVNNVTRHAAAQSCRVSLDAAGRQFTLTVLDDGAGLPPNGNRGIGLASMRERAEELGGTFRLENPPTGGTCLVAILPLEHDKRNLTGQ
jgi:signal transduction histidine kinase